MYLSAIVSSFLYLYHNVTYFFCRSTGLALHFQLLANRGEGLEGQRKDFLNVKKMLRVTGVVEAVEMVGSGCGFMFICSRYYRLPGQGGRSGE